MKKLSIILSLTVLIFSCAKSRVITVTSDSAKSENQKLTFENEHLIINYNFWGNKGLMNFDIVNKTNRPLYFDWKKSAFLPNNVMMSYWQDETNTSATGFNVSSYGYYSRSSKTITASKSVRKERVGIVPPNAKISNAQYLIFPKDGNKLKAGDYAKNDSPLSFRNYLVYGFSEQFTTDENYIDNLFFISKVELVKSVKKGEMQSANRFWISMMK